jgi:uncharacterized protein YggE
LLRDGESGMQCPVDKAAFCQMKEKHQMAGTKVPQSVENVAVSQRGSDMRSLITALVLGSTLWSPAFAADTALITVTGEGSVEAKPDMATINLGVSTEGATAAEAMAANSVQLGAVLEQLRAAGIEDRDLQTSGLSLSPNWQQPQGEMTPRIVGFLAMNQLTVRVRDLEGLGGVLERTIKDGANTFNGMTFGLADPVPVLNEARKRAVADAMARARLLSGAAGVTLGPVVSITEGGGLGGPIPMFRMSAEVASPVPVAAGEISTTASVTMVFELVR